MNPLLVVEDDPGLQKQLKWSFENYQTIIAGDRNTALSAFRRHMPSVVTLDLGLPPDASNASEGLMALKEILHLAPSTKVIVVTGNDDRENALKAIELGAYDFYQKPIDLDVLNTIIQRAFHLDALEKENLRLQQKKKEPLNGIIASCEKMQELTVTVAKIAPSQITTLLLGESGTGKELFARAIHALSDRSNKAFVAVNCAAIPENLLESELFGHEKGAFTGAVKQTKGKIEYAHGGTFFLDEIGDLPFSLQSKLLRFIQERTIERLGGRDEIAVDVRILCATHQNISQLIEQGRFREDLYYRISEMTINIPPLRERQEDAVIIAKTLLGKYNAAYKKTKKGFTEEAIQAIEHYAWPGNVRELENKIKRAVVMAEGSRLSVQDLQIPSAATTKTPALNLKTAKETAETQAIKTALSHANNNVSQAARLLGITRPTLYALLDKYSIVI
ncbi:MAG: PEP-CTERM-box response regulator transcription factor [Gammaproteobacteria bacterium HGW-Gammaproteobacteria-3]|nr:MAG: PEP-CTERM-box response regulator transcription factor [Gammaproteobacteria bacterium HGW-Gammaproteobacteria-3]